MKYFDRIFNFFSTAYTNNSRFHHSTFGPLRIFFERNNKLKASVSNLGTVFRNSKWSDFKTQNIKISLIRSWFVKTLILALALFVILGFLGSYRLLEGFSNIPVLGEAFDVINTQWSNLTNWTRVVIATGYASAYLTEQYVRRRLRQLRHESYEALVRRTKTTTSAKVPASRWPLSSSTCISPELNAVILNLYKASFSLQALAVQAPSIFSQKLANELYLLLHLQRRFKTRSYTISSFDRRYASMPAWLSIGASNLTIRADLLSNCLSTKSPLQLLGLNAQQGLNSAKQDRWALRNSMLGDNLVTNSHAFTQVKKLLGVNLLGSDLSSANVWASTKLGNLTSGKDVQMLTSMQKLLSAKTIDLETLAQFNLSMSDLKNFNEFTASRIWLVKKYFYTSRLSQNLESLGFQPLFNAAMQESKLTEADLAVFAEAIVLDLPTNLSYLNFHLSLQDSGSRTTVLSQIDLSKIKAPDTDILQAENLVFLKHLTSSPLSQDASTRFYFSSHVADTPSLSKLPTLRFNPPRS